MNKLERTFIDNKILHASELNEIVDKVNEIIEKGVGGASTEELDAVKQSLNEVKEAVTGLQQVDVEMKQMDAELRQADAALRQADVMLQEADNDLRQRDINQQKQIDALDDRVKPIESKLLDIKDFIYVLDGGHAASPSSSGIRLDCGHA